MDERPPRRARYIFWVMVALVSFFFAEVVSGNSMIRSLDPGSLAITLLMAVVIGIPVYGLHTIILAKIVYRFGRPGLYTLFFAGVIFALYEAYMTKVLWVGWGEETAWLVGGIAVMETAILLLFWHPFMAFIIPLFASESLLTGSREILSGLPRPLQRLFATRNGTYAALMLFAVICGIYQAGSSPSPLYSIVSELLAFVIFTILLYAYRRAGFQRYDIRQLLPGRREFAVLLGWLLLIYLFLGLAVRPDTLGNLWPQVIVWLLYAFFLLMLYLSLRKSKDMTIPLKSFPVKFTWGLYGTFFLAITIASALMSLVPFRFDTAVFCMLGGTMAGLIMLALSVRDTLKKHYAEATDATDTRVSS